MECLFCKIASGEMPANIIYQDDEIIAFDDIYPKTPYHKLIIPRKHIATVNNLLPEDADLVGRMVLVAQKIATELAIATSGYRLVINCNKDGGQAVYHLHVHLLGGCPIPW